MPKQVEPEKFKNPYPATDIIIEYTQNGEEGVVLIERGNFPYGIAVCGGFAEYGISLEDNAIKEAKEETGLDVKILNPEHPLLVHSNPHRDPRAHIISIFYIGRGTGTITAGDDAKTAAFYSLNDLEKLVKEEPHKFAFTGHVKALNEYLVWKGCYK